MKARFSLGAGVIALVLWLPLNSLAASSRPAARNGGYRQNATVIVQRFRNALGQINLSPDQKSRADALMDKVEAEARDMQGELAGMKPAARLKQVMGLMQEMVGGLRQILTPEQMQQLMRTVRANSPAAGQHPLVTLFRLQQALKQMDLTQDQQAQIAAMVDDVRKQAPALRQAMENGKDVSGQLQAMNAEIRQKLGEILTPGQRQQLHNIMPMIGDLSGPPSQGAPARQPADQTPQSPQSPHEMAPEPIVNQSTAEQIARHTAAVANAPASPQGIAPTGSHVGMMAPNFSLDSLDDVSMQLSNMRGRVVVLEFGSFSSPSFRDRVAAMERLRRQFSGVAMFLVIYTREAHPQGDWQVQRNTDAGIVVNQPTTLDQRRALARRAVVALNIQTPMVVDTMDDAVTKEFGGMPNAAVVIDRSGRIAGRQDWTDPSGLPDLIRAAMAEPTTHPARD